MRYKYLPHAADAKFEAYGRTLEHAFENAAIAVFDMMVDTHSVEKNIRKEISLIAEDRESLLYDFIEDLLVLLDSENFLLGSVTVKAIRSMGDSYQLDALVYGDTFSEKYETFGFVKAMTYSDMSIRCVDGLWIITVVVDR